MDKSRIINGLVGIRALAALWVLLYHSVNVIYFSGPGIYAPFNFMNPLESPILTHGFFGVDIFFVLSGFVMTYTYFDHFRRTVKKRWMKNYAHYIVFRLARIYPALAFVFLVGSVLALMHWLLLPSHNLRNMSAFLTSALLVLTMTHAVIVSSMDQFVNFFWTFDSPLWTIGVEWIAYLFFPFLVFFINGTKKRWLFVIALILFVILQADITLNPPRLHGQVLKSVSYFIYGWPAMLRIAADFFWGFLLYRLYRERRINMQSWVINFVMIAAVAVIVLFINYFHALETPILFLIGIVVFCVAQNGVIARLVFGNAVMVYLGEISYSFYLVHFIVLQLILKVMLDHNWFHYLYGSAVWKITGFSVFLLCTITVSSMIYYAVEKPARRVIRRWIG